ncbi:MAG TPA: cupredoxin family copper-binding protein [Candidatus Eremiobacteraceae bacterium]|nr:cupredoxin family copper-binding protein [Candidatus Eremiobacteraceae bacterium]
MTARKGILGATIFFVLGSIVFGVVYRTMAARPVDASSVEVKIDNFSFTPPSLKVRVGTQITWTNRDDIPHTVVEEEKIFRSKVLDTDEKFAFTPTKPGTYKYYCSIHPKMTAKVVVE